MFSAKITLVVTQNIYRLLQRQNQKLLGKYKQFLHDKQDEWISDSPD